MSPWSRPASVSLCDLNDCIRSFEEKDTVFNCIAYAIVKFVILHYAVKNNLIYISCAFACVVGCLIIYSNISDGKKIVHIYTCKMNTIYMYLFTFLFWSIFCFILGDIW